MKTITKLCAFLIVFFLYGTSIVYAQQVSTLYFMDNNPYRNKLNPAFQPLSNIYIGLPAIGYTQFGIGNNALSIKDMYNPDGTTKDIISILKENNKLLTDININLLTFGFRVKDAYWNFSATQRFDINSTVPKRLVNAIEAGTLDNSIANININAFTEIGLGYARKFNDKFNAGLKFKVLLGQANAQLQSNSMYVDEIDSKLNLINRGTIRVSSPFVINGVEQLPEMPDVTEFLKPSGIGAAFDLGATYKVLDNLTLSAALTDFGIISWNNNNKKYNYEFTADQLPLNQDGLDMLKNNPKDFYELLDSTENSFTTNLAPKLNLGVEYGFYQNRLSLGLLSRNTFYKDQLFSELTASVNAKPVNWFDLSASYSILNGRGSNIGAGMGVRLGFLYLFASADYIPLNYNKKIIFADYDNLEIPALNTRNVNLAVGVNFVFGNKQDKDKDGVKDRRDKCPDTPFGVIVTKTGCPLDTDGDGVYDFLDKCPDTPKEAYGAIDGDGCPLDTDGDGVYDFKDKCAETPMAAYGKVDSVGCPKDTDMDGVADYLDKCPGTPTGATVDSVGCSIDTDKDGVPDYIDKCPDTPKEAFGLVDAVGCPSDNDQDEVPDYLDKCLNTVIEARAMVDSVGCPLDTDKDGVYNYLDKCPDTPKAAFGFVDTAGCPIDSDGDGVYDYNDNCPKVAGVASNFGCPEIKKEVRMLFQKALQGIQFETGKATIKPVSFTILNQVANVLNENPSYLIEVQGHTDNVGKVEMNKTLSENRANAVRNYIIAKGVDEKRITANGYGDTKPVVPNTSAKNKAKNRRVEFVVSFEEIKIEVQQ